MYAAELNSFAQSILSGTQKLKELGAEEEDEYYDGTKSVLKQADESIWALVDYIENGRKSE